jgi:DNA repair exonuclease SbcCD ATPase subunit
MTELAEQWHGVSDHDEMPDDRQTTTTFVGFVHTLEEESERLRSLAEACQQAARDLAERETSLDSREQALHGAQHELDSRRRELERWQQELDARTAEVDRASARIAEAAEREAALKSLAHDLLERYSDDGAH